MEVTLPVTLITCGTSRIFFVTILVMTWCCLPQMVQANFFYVVEHFKAFIQPWILDQVGGLQFYSCLLEWKPRAQTKNSSPITFRSFILVKSGVHYA